MAHRITGQLKEMIKSFQYSISKGKKKFKKKQLSFKYVWHVSDDCVDSWPMENRFKGNKFKGFHVGYKGYKSHEPPYLKVHLNPAPFIHVTQLLLPEMEIQIKKNIDKKNSVN